MITPIKDTPPDDRDATSDETSEALEVVIEKAESDGYLRLLFENNPMVRNIILKGYMKEHEQALIDIMKRNDDKEEEQRLYNDSIEEIDDYNRDD